MQLWRTWKGSGEAVKKSHARWANGMYSEYTLEGSMDVVLDDDDDGVTLAPQVRLLCVAEDGGFKVESSCSLSSHKNHAIPASNPRLRSLPPLATS